MTEARRARIAELIVSEEVRRTLPDYLSFVSDALGSIFTEADLLPSEVSDELRIQIEKQVRLGFQRPYPQNHVVFNADELDDFKRVVSKIAQEFQDVAFHLMSWEKYPLVLVKALKVASRVGLPWRFGDGLTMCNADGSRGLCAVFNANDQRECFEIISWSGSGH